MKKLISSLMAVMLIVVMTPKGLSANNEDTITSATESKTIDIMVTYSNSTEPGPTYSVNVEWESMDFVYATENTPVWNYTDRNYTTSGEGTWSKADDKGGEIKVTNNSNVNVKVSLAAAIDASYPGITAALSVPEQTLEAVKGPDLAKYFTSTVSLSGTPTMTSMSGTVIGSITVSIAQEGEPLKVSES